MLLVEHEESTALQVLREMDPVESDDEEPSIQNSFLIAEIQSATPFDQATTILNSSLDTMYLDLGRACHTPSSSELDRLVDAYRGDEKMLGRLATILAEHDLELSQGSFDAFSELLGFDDPDNACGAAWVLLGSNAAERLGHALNLAGWSWSKLQAVHRKHHGFEGNRCGQTWFPLFAFRLFPRPGHTT